MPDKPSATDRHAPLRSIAVAAAADSFRRYLVDLLVEICRLDTSIRADVAALGRAEAAVFEVLERELASFGLERSRVERAPINARIAAHPFFSPLYYTRGADHPAGLDVDETYAGRGNLLFLIDGAGQRSDGIDLALNAHVDVIAPFIPPRVEGNTVFGRGSCDDKGNVVAMIGALKLAADWLHAAAVPLNRSLTAMFVIEEEMGGNGSLSLAIDRGLKTRYDSLVVLEICQNRLYPGNRGCVWYKVEGQLPGANLFEAAAFIIDQLEQTGRALRAESDHPLFPHRPVQTCHGILGNCGQHPSRINGEIAFDIVVDGGDARRCRHRIDDLLRAGLDEYTGLYGDKTQPGPWGGAKVERHFDITEAPCGYTVTVHGSTAHMGAIRANDGAITKMMALVRALIRGRKSVCATAGAESVSYRQNGWPDPSQLILEGGQGFVPTHDMEQVMRRMREAVWRGGDDYFRLTGNSAQAADVLQVTYDKLHNAAFAGNPNSPSMRTAIKAAKAAAIWTDQPIQGWDVSCDARLFAGEYPELDVITTGAGALQFAHADNEQIDVAEMIRCAEFLAYFILMQTGTLTRAAPASRGSRVQGQEPEEFST